MKAVGVVVEYNPFHNGHAYHVEQSKKEANAEIVIAAMSGNFLQRGEPALVSKWTRAEMALMGGVDIVFELPFQFATQQAEIFANGAVSLLSKAGCEAICFGSENGKIEAFKQADHLIQNNDAFFQSKVREYISQGVSYPKALSLAFKEVNTNKEIIDLTKPNNILGFYYFKAAQHQTQIPNILTIKRQSSDYHDAFFASESIASATSIRQSLFSDHGEIEKIKPFLPNSSLRLLLNYKNMYHSFHDWELYWPFLQYKLIQSTPKELREIHGVEEGIENRLLKAVLQADSFMDFMNLIKTKRYTWTRLQRLAVHILSNTKKSEMALHNQKDVRYLRLLGMTEKGRYFLNKNKHQFSIPLISKLSSYKSDNIELDIRASKIYAMGLSDSRQELFSQEFNQKPIYLH